jgi:hypothetical protein
MTMMNSRDNQQYVPCAGYNVNVVNIGHIDIESIQSDVDLYLKELHEQWKASIPFMCYVINEYDQPCTSSLGNTLSKILDRCNCYELAGSIFTIDWANPTNILFHFGI